MKTRKVGLEHSHIFNNNICRHIILEAPTASELEKKIKEYELILSRAITNAYKLSRLSLEKNDFYHISPNNSYQVSIFMNFIGKKKEEITNPERTLQYVKQLTALESKKMHESNTIQGSSHLIKEVLHTETIVIEVNQKSNIDEEISVRQREFLEHIIPKTNLTNITFLTTAKNIDPQTGKITISLLVQYKCKEIVKRKAEHSDLEEQENR